MASNNRPSSAGSELRQGLLANVSVNRWTADGDLASHGHHGGTTWASLLALSWQATGVIYGDILTSCLYVMTGIFEGKGGGQPTPEDAIGVTSLIIWTIFTLVVCKYALIVLRADDNGNGGTFALFSLVRRATMLQLEVQGRDLPSDYTLTHYTTHPDDPHAKQSGAAAGQEEGAGQHVVEVYHNHAGMPNGGARRLHRVPSARRGSAHKQGAGPRDWRLELGKSWWLRKTIAVMVVTGVGFVLGDGTITPAISVLSAVEGLKGVVHGIHREEVVMITVAILIGLFTIQRFGTSKVSVIFAPIIALWLAFNTVIGIHNIVTHHPRVLMALYPWTWIKMAWAKPMATWYKLSGVLLCVTGTEALFADLAHFSRPSIQLSCLALVFPALVVTYLGQGAYLAAHPHHIKTLFWHSVPKVAYWPMLVLATLATITASQALISAVFSVVSQAMSQGFFPKFGVVHTSRKVHGQIYIPVINHTMMLLTVGVVLLFQESSRLGAAYGIAVCCDMLLTTIFTSLVISLTWRMSLAVSLLFLLVFGSVEGAFFSASLSKIPNGGWLTLLMAAIWGIIMWTWYWGTSKKIKWNDQHVKRLRDVLRQEVRLGDKDLEERVTLLDSGEQVERYKGVGLYFCETVQGVPPGICNLFRKVPALPRVVIFVTNRRVPVPDVMQSERLLVAPLALSGFYHVVVRYGYMEEIRQGKRFASYIIAQLNDLLMQSRSLHQQVLNEAHSLSPQPIPRTSSNFALTPRMFSMSAPSAAAPVHLGPEGLPAEPNAGTLHHSSSRVSLPDATGPSTGPSEDAAAQQQGSQQRSPVGSSARRRDAAGQAAHSSEALASVRPQVSSPCWNPSTSGRAIADQDAVQDAGDCSQGVPRRQSNHSLLSEDSQQDSTSRWSRSSVRGGAGPLRGLWRSLSDNALLGEEEPFESEEQVLPFAPTTGGGGAEVSGSSAMRSLLEEEGIRLQALDQEMELLRRNFAARTVCFFGRTHIRAREGSHVLRRIMLEHVYQVLVNNFSPSAYEAFGLPLEQVIEVAQVYKL